MVSTNGDGKITINDRRIDGSTMWLERAHDRLLGLTWTSAMMTAGYGFTDLKEMTYYFDLGVDGLFTDFADTGVEVARCVNKG